VINPEEQVRVAGVTRIEEPDVIEAFRHLPSPPSWRLVAGFGAAAAAAAALLVGLLVRDGFSLRGLSAHSGLFAIALTLAFLTVGVSRAKRRIAKRSWAAMAEWQRQVRFELTDTGFRVRTERSSNEFDWELHEAWLESPTAFYVAQPGQRYIIVPKRAFENESEVAQVRELLRAKVHVPPAAMKRANAIRRAPVLWVVLILLCVVLYQVVTRP